MKPKYFKNLSYLRAFACIAIVLMHTVNSAAILHQNELSRSAYAGSMAAVQALSWAVPCFLMISGALLLDPGREMPLKKLFKNYILRVAAALAACSMLFRVLDMGLNGEAFSFKALLRGLYNLVTGSSWAHLWYLYVLIGLYLLLPLFRAAVQRFSEKELWYLALVLFVFASILPLFEMAGVSIGFSIPIATVYPLYLFLGYLLFQKPLSRIVSILLILLGAGGLIAASLVYYSGSSDVLGPLLSYASPACILLSIGIFSLFAQAKSEAGENVFSQGLLALDRCSFGIYLLHLIFIRLMLRYWGANPYSLGLWSFAVISLSVLAVSFLLVWLLCMLPGVRFVLGGSARVQSGAMHAFRKEGYVGASAILPILLTVGVAAYAVLGAIVYDARSAVSTPVSSQESSASEVSKPAPEPPEESTAKSGVEESSTAPESSADPPEESETSEVTTPQSAPEDTSFLNEATREKAREQNPRAAAVLDEVGWNLKAAFDWVTSFTWQYMYVDYSMGAEWFMDYGYEYRMGNCFVMASTFCDLAKLLGYDARIMVGQVPMLRGGDNIHCWVEINISGNTYVFDPDFAHETEESGFMITYGQFGTWYYHDYFPMP